MDFNPSWRVVVHENYSSKPISLVGLRGVDARDFVRRATQPSAWSHLDAKIAVGLPNIKEMTVD
ncbi:MAG: hypothetical protein ABI672_12410 [Vicinamibacteria bacterium]